MIKVSDDDVGLTIITDINAQNCNFVFEDYYTSLLELIQAHAFNIGFNIHNHICIGFFLRDYIEDRQIFEVFDDLRYKRNSLTYYGKRMDFDTAMNSISKCKRIISEIKKMLL